MIDRPEVDGAVFVRGLRDCVVRSTPGGDEEDEGDVDRNEEGVVEIRRGDVWVLRWRGVRGAVRRGDVELV
jgi:GINS complex subunit 4